MLVLLFQAILTVIGFVLLFSRQSVAALVFLVPAVMIGFLQLLA